MDFSFSGFNYTEYRATSFKPDILVQYTLLTINQQKIIIRSKKKKF